MENNFVANSISKLYLHSYTADVHFAFTTGNNVPAHKAILAISSPVFEAMFFGQMKENDVVQIVYCDAASFEEFLQLFYLPQVSISKVNMDAVVRLADKYDMFKRLNSCAELLENKLTKENVIWAYELAISLNNLKIKTSCETLIQAHSNYVFESDMFLKCDSATVQHILRIDPLFSSEYEIFKACIKWAETACEANGMDGNDPNILRTQLGDCFCLIRFGAMTSAEIGSILSNRQYNGLFDRVELADILGMKSDKNFVFKALKDSQRLLRAFKWDSNNILEYPRVYDPKDRSTIFIKSRESTWFSSNVGVLFGEMIFVRLFENTMCTVDFSAYIIEYNEQLFSSNIPSKTLYMGTVHLTSQNNAILSLPQPIMIHPNRMYEIRLEALLLPVTKVHKCNFPWKPAVNLDEQITIKFHKSPFEGSSNHQGLVKSFKFNRI